MKRRISALLVTLVICALVAGPALASAPSRTTVVNGEEDWFLLDCGEFEARFHGVSTVEITIFFDEDGTAVRDVERVQGITTFYNGTKGIESGYSGRHAFTNMISLVDGGFVEGVTIQQVGKVLQLNIPHLGNVVMEVGRTTYVVEFGGEWMGVLTLTGAYGQHPWKLHEPLPELCDLLA